MQVTTVDGDTGERVAEAGVRALLAVVVGILGLLSIYLWFGLLLPVAAVLGPLLPVASGGGSPPVLVRQSLIALSTLLGAATITALYLYGSGRGLDFIDVRVPGLRDAGWGIAGLVALLATLYASGVVMDLLGIEQATHGVVQQARGNPEILLVSIPASILLIGPGEELLYRNVVQKSLYEAFSRPAAIVVATVIFAAVHFTAYLSPTIAETLVSLVVVFTLALVLGVVFERTENLVVVAAVHGAFNAIQFADLYCELTGACPI